MESETHSTEETRNAGTESTEKVNGPEAMIEKLIARLASAIEMLERAVPHSGISASEAVGPIVAMVEGNSREAELTQKLAEAEKTIAELRAHSSAQPAVREGRRTLPVSLLAKQDVSAPEPGAIDAALISLSLEQRIAVKAQLLRSGLA